MSAKKIMAMCAVLLTAFCVQAATEVVDGIEWTYTIDGNLAYVGGGETAVTNQSGTVTTRLVTAIPQDTQGSVAIPLNLGGRAVAGINVAAFLGCSSITNIVLHNSISNIQNNAFRNCSSLREVVLPRGLLRINGSWVFAGCSNLQSVTIPRSLSWIHCGVFRDCLGLKEVYIEDIGRWSQVYYGDYLGNPLYYGADLYLNGQVLFLMPTAVFLTI